MSNETWLDIIRRIGILPDFLQTGADSNDCAGTFSLRGQARATAVPSTRLWPRAEDAPAAIGVLVHAPLAYPGSLALHMAAVAIERGIMPVILSTCDQTGLEPFGLRIERLTLHEGTPDPAEMADLRAYWDIVMVIEAGDIAALG